MFMSMTQAAAIDAYLKPLYLYPKDRKGRSLDFYEKEYYQKIITVLKLTIDMQ
jgi:hypothetical protein